uniref:Relaxin family peptide receptor 3 n=2 Tax=Pipistrellus kuhlii TaxID=59472 RepID=A0A7J7YYZ4_PIPKU|nr:relaxin family peptide receptor 3 [Pipistrellus kuhlii]
MSAAAGGAALAGLSGRVPDPLREAEANASANSSLPPRGALRWELGPEPPEGAAAGLLPGGGPGPGDAAEARVRLLLSAAYWAVCALGLAGNLLVLCLLRSRRAGRASAIRLFVTHLALTDLQFVLTLPFWAVEHARDFRWPFGGAMCKLVSLATSVNMYGSVFFLTAMSVARYRSVAAALGRRGGRGCGGRAAGARAAGAGAAGAGAAGPGCGGRGCGGRGARALCALIWAAAVLASLPNGLFATAVPVLGQELCLLRFPGRGQFWLGLYHLQKVLLGFLLPLAVTSLSYLLLLRALAERRVAAAPGGAPEARGGLAAAASARRRSRVTRSVSVLVLAFFLCWLPNQALTAWGALVKLGAAPFSRAFFLGQAYAFPASVCLAHANSCLNPLLYCLARRDCRRALRALLGRLAKPSLPGLARPCTASTRPDPGDPAPPGPAPRRPPAEPEPRFYPPGAVVYSGGRQDPLPSSSAG